MPSDRDKGFDTIFETMPADARASVRGRLLATISADARMRRGRSLSARAIAAYLAASMTASGVAYASSGSMPGEALYPVKLAVEEISIASAPTRAMREALQERSALRRADEIGAVVRDVHDEREVEKAVGRFEKAASRALTGQDDEGQAEKRLREKVEKVPSSAQGKARLALDKAYKRASSVKYKKNASPASKKSSAGKRASSKAKPSAGKGKSKKK